MMLNKNRYDEVRWLYKKVEPILSNNWTIIIVVVHIQIAGIFSYFIYILNTVRVNSKTVWCLKNYLDLKETKTFKFSSNLSSKLTKKAFTENRQINGLGTTVIDKLEKAFDRSLYKEWPPGGNGNRYPWLGETKRRCNKCEIGATKVVKDNLTKSKEQCEVCGTSVCHTRICGDCIEQRKK